MSMLYSNALTVTVVVYSRKIGEMLLCPTEVHSKVRDDFDTVLRRTTPRKATQPTAETAAETGAQ